MDGCVPFHDGLAVDMAQLCAHILGKQSLGADKVELSQGFQHSGQFIEVRTYLVGHLGEDAYDFTGDLGFGLAYAVIGLDDGIRLNKYGFSCRALVMHDAMEFALVHRTHGQYQPAVAQRGLNVVIQYAFLLALGDDAAQGAVDATGHASDRHT